MDIFCIVLGLVSLLFAIHAFQVRGCLICCTISLAACGGALLGQLWELSRLAAIPDSSSIYDTVNARVLAGGILLAANILLHTAALLSGRKRNTCESC